MVWWLFLLQLTSNWLQFTPEGPKPDTERSSAIQTRTSMVWWPYLLSYCNLPVEYFTGQCLPTAASHLQSSTQLTPADVDFCRPCFHPLHCTVLSVHRYYRLLPFAPLLPLHALGPSHRSAIFLNLSWHISGRRDTLAT